MHVTMKLNYFSLISVLWEYLLNIIDNICEFGG